MKKVTSTQNKLIAAIIEGIEEKKGQEIISIDISKTQNPICNNFIICHADSSVQVKAIANSVEEIVSKKANEKVWQIEGQENSTWICMDYVSVIVHIFQRSYRELYNIEALWADSRINRIK